MHSNQVGIIGGGQLALMLADSASRMGLKPIVLAEDSFSPAAQNHPDAIFGDMKDEETLDYFFSQTSQIIFENEFVDCELLKRVSQGKEIRFFPALDTILKFQDKLEQKRILENLDIPTAKYFILKPEENLKEQLAKVLNAFQGSCVLKWARMGYDGKGVLVIDSSAESLKKAHVFCEEARKKKSSVYAEQKVDFKRELAIVSVLSTKGEFLSYPLVVSEQTEGICSRVYGPAIQLGVAKEKEIAAQKYAQLIAESCALVGAFAIELFETHDGRLWVNEIAPRVHNSGHYTQNACNTDQFENHWRAILGLPLGSVSTWPCFAMLNLLGPDIRADRTFILPTLGPRTHLHWYHKREIRRGRKLGHLNATAASIKELDNLLMELSQSHQNWLDQLELKKEMRSSRDK